jgi:hypothetical protein
MHFSRLLTYSLLLGTCTQAVLGCPETLDRLANPLRVTELGFLVKLTVMPTSPKRFTGMLIVNPFK